MPEGRNLGTGGLFSALGGGTPAYQRSSSTSMITTGDGRSTDNPAAMSTKANGSRALPTNTRQATSHTRRSSASSTMATADAAMNANTANKIDTGLLRMGNNFATMTTRLENAINKQSAMIEKQTMAIINKLEQINKSINTLSEMFKKANDQSIKMYDLYNKQIPKINWAAAFTPEAIYKQNFQFFERWITSKVTLEQFSTALLGFFSKNPTIRRLFSYEYRIAKEDKAAMPWTRENSTALVKTIPNAMKEMDKTIKNNTKIVAARLDKHFISFQKSFEYFAKQSFEHYAKNEELLAKIYNNSNIIGTAGVRTNSDVRRIEADFRDTATVFATYYKTMIANLSKMTGLAFNVADLTFTKAIPTNSYLKAARDFQKLSDEGVLPTKGKIPAGQKKRQSVFTIASGGAHDIKPLSDNLKALTVGTSQLNKELRENTGAIETSSSMAKQQVTAMQALVKGAQFVFHPTTVMSVLGKVMKYSGTFGLAGLGFAGLRWLRDNNTVRTIGAFIRDWVWTPAKQYLIDPLIAGIKRIAVEHLSPETVEKITGAWETVSQFLVKWGGATYAATMGDETARANARRTLEHSIMTGVGNALKTYVVPPLTRIALLAYAMSRASSLPESIKSGYKTFTRDRLKSEKGTGKIGINERLRRFTPYNRIARGTGSIGTGISTAVSNNTGLFRAGLTGFRRGYGTPVTGTWWERVRGGASRAVTSMSRYKAAQAKKPITDSLLLRTAKATKSIGGGILNIGGGLLSMFGSMLPYAMLFKTLFSNVLIPFIQKKGINAGDKKGIASAVKDFAINMVKGMFNVVSTAVKDMGGVRGVVETVLSAFGGLCGGIFEGLKQAFGATGVIDLAAKVAGSIFELFTTLLEKIGSTLWNIIGDVAYWVTHGLDSGKVTRRNLERRRTEFITGSLMKEIEANPELKARFEALKQSNTHVMDVNDIDWYSNFSAGISETQELSDLEIARQLVDELKQGEIEAASFSEEALKHSSFQDFKAAEKLVKEEEAKKKAEEEAKRKAEAAAKKAEEEKQDSFRSKVGEAITNLQNYFSEGTFRKDLDTLVTKAGDFFKGVFEKFRGFDVKKMGTSMLDSIGKISGKLFSGIMGEDRAFDFFSKMQESADANGLTLASRFAKRARHTIASDVQDIATFTGESSERLEAIRVLLEEGIKFGWDSEALVKVVAAADMLKSGGAGAGGSVNMTDASGRISSTMGTIESANIGELKGRSLIAVNKGNEAAGSVYAAGLLIPNNEKANARVSGYFGEERTDPPHTHAGIDIASGSAMKILAPYEGTVRYAGTYGGYGRSVVLEHNINGQTYTTLYGHLEDYGAGIKRGMAVNAGTILGYMGTSWASGYGAKPVDKHYPRHLHFGVAKGNAVPLQYTGYSAINPTEFLATVINARKSLSTEVGGVGENVIETIGEPKSGGDQPVDTTKTAATVETANTGSQSGVMSNEDKTFSFDFNKRVDELLGTGLFDGRYSPEEQKVLVSKFKTDKTLGTILQGYNDNFFYKRDYAANDVLKYLASDKGKSLDEEIREEAHMMSYWGGPSDLGADPELQKMITEKQTLDSIDRGNDIAERNGTTFKSSLDRANELNAANFKANATTAGAQLYTIQNNNAVVATTSSTSNVGVSSNSGNNASDAIDTAAYAADICNMFTGSWDLSGTNMRNF